MLNLIAAAAVFIAMRRAIAGTRLRAVIVALIGERLYLALFSVTTVLVLAWLGFAYAGARSAPANGHLFELAIDMRPGQLVLQLVLQLVAFVLVVTGLSTRNPTITTLGGLVHRKEPVVGILRVTRHPFLWGIAIFALGHMLVRTDIASWILFGTLAFVALTGTVSIDAKRKAVFGEAWEAFVTRTSNLPFAAIVQGKQAFRPGEIGWVRLAVAIGAFVLFAIAHPFLFGGSVLR